MTAAPSDEVSEGRRSPRAEVYVLYDPNIPATIEISEKLGASLWSRKHGRPGRTDRIVVVVDRPDRAKQVMESTTSGTWRPALVVGWALPEPDVASLLELRIPVVDGSVLVNQQDARSALEGAWSSERFEHEISLARELARLEEHVELTRPSSVPMM
jgi:hypothetical protein